MRHMSLMTKESTQKFKFKARIQENMLINLTEIFQLYNKHTYTLHICYIYVIDFSNISVFFENKVGRDLTELRISIIHVILSEHDDIDRQPEGRGPPT